MPLDSKNKIQVLCGCRDFDKMSALRPLRPFSETVCSFLSEVSSALMKEPEAKQFSDVVTFGFFCRRGNLVQLEKPYENMLGNRLGRGISFHIAPSNVPINFAYSLVSALLAGNACIVRASAKPFRQVELVCGCMARVLEDDRFSSLRDYISVVRYPREEEINSYFSSIADIRIIWGGDATVADIRRSPLPPRAVEISFADRYSIAVIGAEGYLALEKKEALAQDFYNDTYLFDQNACSSPRLIYWLGDEDTAEKAKEIFWKHLHDLLIGKYKVEPVIAVDKLTAACRLAISRDAGIVNCGDNLISRIKLRSLSSDICDYRCAGGSFIEYTSDSLDGLETIVTRRYQTLAYAGADKEDIARFVRERALCGIDRIVPVGKTSDFALVWDGYDLIMQMTRIISVK